MGELLQPNERHLLHINDIEVVGPYMKDPPAAYHSFWVTLHKLQAAGHLIYLSGRSTFMHHISLGLYKHRNPMPPKGSELWLLVIDSFDREDIINFFRRRKFLLSNSCNAKVIDAIHKATGGMARLITVLVTDYLAFLDDVRDDESLCTCLLGLHFANYVTYTMHRDILSPYPLLRECTSTQGYAYLYRNFLVLSAEVPDFNQCGNRRSSLWLQRTYIYRRSAPRTTYHRITQICSRQRRWTFSPSKSS